MTDGLHGFDRQRLEERIEELEDETQELRALVEALRNMNTDLRDRVEELEEIAADDGLDDATIDVDHIDQKVVARLEPGQVVSPNEFSDLYKTYTTVKNEDTVRKRMKALVKRDAFEFIKPGVWRFEPENGGDGDD